MHTCVSFTICTKSFDCFYSFCLCLSDSIQIRMMLLYYSCFLVVVHLATISVCGKINIFYLSFIHKTHAQTQKSHISTRFSVLIKNKTLNIYNS